MKAAGKVNFIVKSKEGRKGQREVILVSRNDARRRKKRKWHGIRIDLLYREASMRIVTS